MSVKEVVHRQNEGGVVETKRTPHHTQNEVAQFWRVLMERGRNTIGARTTTQPV